MSNNKKECTKNNLDLCSNMNCDICNKRRYFNSGKKCIQLFDLKRNNVSQEQINKIKDGSNIKYWFKCDNIDCGHNFQKAPKYKTGCSYCCSGAKNICNKEDNCNICYNKSIILNPYIINWNYKINKKHPEEIYKSSTKDTIWFNCHKCNHIFDITPNHLTAGNRCKYCCHNSDSFCDNMSCNTCLKRSFKSSPIINKWDIDNNFDDKGILVNPRFKALNSHYLGHFICDKEHNYTSLLYNISCNNSKCPKCYNKTEDIFNYWFINNYEYKLLYQTRYEWCRAIETNNNFMPFDFCIEELKLIIEIDGPQHFQQIAKWKTPEQTFKNDTYKIQQAFNNNYSIIRIYQPDILYDTNNWDTNFNKIFRNYKIPKTPFMVCIGDQDLYEKYNNLHISPKINRPSANCFNCKICNQTFKLKNRYELHIKSKKHQKNLSIKK